MATISAQEFFKGGNPKKATVVQPASSVQVEQAKPNFFQRVGEDFNKRGQEVIKNSQQFAANPSIGNLVQQGFQTAGQFAGGVGDIFGEALSPAINKVVDKVSDIPAVQNIATSEPASDGLDKVSGTMESYKQWAQEHPEAAKNLESAVNIASLLPLDVGVRAASSGVKVGTEGLMTGAKNLVGGVDDAVKSSVDNVGQKIAGGLDDQPAKIMQRVARIPKQKQAKFEQMAGESVGGYLSRRGIFGNIEDITTNLYERLTRHKGYADTALAGLKGRFKPQPVKTALDELIQREIRVSADGAPSPDIRRISQLYKKFDEQGLDMSEINEVKRFYERNNKVDYLKSVSSNPENVVRATNIDTAIRRWQFDKAKELGLKNLDSINKETQLAKRLLDDIGAEYSGSAGNNAITITDWILLAGGDPTAVGAFLVKKGASSKTVQSFLAEKLNKGKGAMGDVKADVGESSIKGLPAPSSRIRSEVRGSNPIRIAPKGSRAESTKR